MSPRSAPGMEFDLNTYCPDSDNPLKQPGRKASVPETGGDFGDERRRRPTLEPVGE